MIGRKHRVLAAFLPGLSLVKRVIRAATALLFQRPGVCQRCPARWRSLGQQHFVALQCSTLPLLQIFAVLPRRVLSAFILHLRFEPPQLGDHGRRPAVDGGALSRGRGAAGAIPELARRALVEGLDHRRVRDASSIISHFAGRTGAWPVGADTVPQIGSWRIRSPLVIFLFARSVVTDPVMQIGRARLHLGWLFRRILPDARRRSDLALAGNLLIGNHASGTRGNAALGPARRKGSARSAGMRRSRARRIV